MKLSLTLSLTMALSIASFLRDRLGHSSFRGQVSDSEKKLVLTEKQLHVDTQCQASNWPFRLGLSPCPRRVRYRVSRVIVTEGLKQEPLGTDQKSFSLPYPLNQLWVYTAPWTLAQLFLEGLLIIFTQSLLRVAHDVQR